MTLHEPCSLTQDGNVITKSIIMEVWALVTQLRLVARNCFYLRLSILTLSLKKIIIIRCSGWRQPINMSFINPPPFLVFDISSTFRENIKTLDILLHEITAYIVSYRLAGITSYVESRRHYVGYILHNGHFLYYDGIPSTNPVFERYHGKDIEGDITFVLLSVRKER